MTVPQYTRTLPKHAAPRDRTNTVVWAATAGTCVCTSLALWMAFLQIGP